MQFLEQKQAKDAVQTYMNLVEKCFGDCVDDFTSRAMSSKEV
jgi:import inner membrane translocase subunit TIM9